MSYYIPHFINITLAATSSKNFIIVSVGYFNFRCGSVKNFVNMASKYQYNLYNCTCNTCYALQVKLSSSYWNVLL